MTLSDLTRWTVLVLATWLLAIFAFGCARSSHVKAVNTAAVTLEATAHELLAEYERGRPEDTDEARVYAERWTPVVHALSAAYAAHDGWRLLVERNADDIAIIAAASRARDALCNLREAARGLMSTGALGGICAREATI